MSHGLVALVLLPLLAAGLGRSRRAASAALLATAAVAAYFFTFRLGGLPARPTAELWQPLWRVLAVNRLQLTVGLGVDGPAAAGLCGLALLATWAVRTAEPHVVAWLGVACAAAAVALLGDGLVTRLVGWELLTGVGWVLSPRRGVAGLGVGRAGDATLLVATALLFWSVGGSWSAARSESRYQLDAAPPATGAAAEQGDSSGPTLALAPLRRSLSAGASGPSAGAALANKLWLGGRLLTWLAALLGLAAGLKAVAGLLQLLAARRASAALRLWLFLAPLLAGGHLLWRLR